MRIYSIKLKVAQGSRSKELDFYGGVLVLVVDLSVDGCCVSEDVCLRYEVLHMAGRGHSAFYNSRMPPKSTLRTYFHQIFRPQQAEYCYHRRRVVLVLPPRGNAMNRRSASYGPGLDNLRRELRISITSHDYQIPARSIPNASVCQGSRTWIRTSRSRQNCGWQPTSVA